MHWIYQALETNIVPDFLIRRGIRNFLAIKLKELDGGSVEANAAALMAYVAELKTMPVAIQQDAANEQHYELPASFFKLVLGTQLKYSCAHFDQNCESLDQAETAMLALTCERAELSDGQSILELGCGWGSLSLFMAQRYPNARILSISNSKSQKVYIDSQIKARGLTNLIIRTADMVDFAPERDQEQEQEQEKNCPRKFDRVVSVEMFEHLKNYEIVLARVSNWLQENGKLFIHIFTHRHFAYHYENKDGDDWLTEHFFTGGMMPSDNLMLYFQDQLKIVNHWRVSGTHYQKTAEGWLSNMDRNREQIMPILVETYGEEYALKWWVYWRVFFMSCAELWGYKNGQEWIVSHYLFSRR